MSDDFIASSADADAALLADLGRQLERARLARNLTQQELAARAGVGKRTVERIESGASTTTVNLVRVLRALDLLEVLAALAPDEEPSPFEQLRAARRVRRRASPRRGPGSAGSGGLGARGGGARRMSGPGRSPAPPRSGELGGASGEAQSGGPSGAGADERGDEPFRWGDEE